MDGKIAKRVDIASLELQMVNTELFCTWDEDCQVTNLEFDFSIMDGTSEETVTVGTATVQLLDPQIIQGDILEAADCCSQEAHDSYVLFENWRKAHKKKSTLTAFLQSIEILPELRGQGIGSLCIQQVLLWFERLHVEYAVLIAHPLSSDTDNMTAERIKEISCRLAQWYGRCGFEILSEDDEGTIMFLPIKQRRL